MSESGFLSISNFAKFSRTTRDALHLYDKIGLLSPVSRGKNKYRYYSSGQLSVINVIHTLQALDMSLAEIKQVIINRNPEQMAAMLTNRIEKIDQKITEWNSVRRLLVTLRDTINSVLDIDENKITIQYLPAESIVLGAPNDYRNGKTDFDVLPDFYRSAGIKYPDLNLNYPAWGFFSEERIKRGDWSWPDRYYSCHPDGPHEKPAAFYAIGFMRGGYGGCGELYRRLVDYIDKQDFEICGDAYEEYPLNELCIPENNNYLIRIMITVRKKNSTESKKRAAKS